MGSILLTLAGVMTTVGAKVANCSRAGPGIMIVPVPVIVALPADTAPVPFTEFVALGWVERKAW
jgi:hypothetical protein